MFFLARCYTNKWPGKICNVPVIVVNRGTNDNPTSARGSFSFATLFLVSGVEEAVEDTMKPTQLTHHLPTLLTNK